MISRSRRLNWSLGRGLFAMPKNWHEAWQLSIGSKDVCPMVAEIFWVRLGLCGRSQTFPTAPENSTSPSGQLIRIYQCQIFFEGNQTAIKSMVMKGIQTDTVAGICSGIRLSRPRNNMTGYQKTGYIYS